jgi:hypothetical protein
MGRPIGERAMTATELQRRWRAKVKVRAQAAKVTAANAHVDRLIQAAVHTATEKYQVMVEKSFAQQKSILDGWKESQRWAEFNIRWLQDELVRERDRRLEPIDPDSLPKHYREKLKHARARQDREFDERVKQGVQKVLDELRNSARQSESPVTRTGYQDLREVTGATVDEATKH